MPRRPTAVRKARTQTRASTSRSPLSQAELIALLRKKAQKFLRAPGVTSVGVGEELTGGSPTGRLAIQFTVHRKRSKRALASVSDLVLPDFIEDDNGVKVPVDVVQRGFRPAYQVVTPGGARAEHGSDWETRRDPADPIRPGVSVGHIDANGPGTIGAIVYDRTSGEPLILSNWHILHTGWGAIGDAIYQPAPNDSATGGVVGRLLRSHVGLAGDCAVATVEARAIDRAILGLGVTPLRVARAELGDRLVKSGRTSGVTYAVVRRVGVVTTMNYDGERIDVGGFELGPDPQAPPVDGEISMPGDSGALWLLNSQGADADIAVGLHFSGESDPRPEAEYALACNIHSVLDRLAVTFDRP